MIKLLEPDLKRCVKNKEESNLLKALIDLDVRNDEEFNCLCDEYQNILRRKDDIETAYKNESIILDRLYGLITDCYIDRFKLKGINVKAKIPQLLQLLNNYDYEHLVLFLNESTPGDGLARNNIMFADSFDNHMTDDFD